MRRRASDARRSIERRTNARWWPGACRDSNGKPFRKHERRQRRRDRRDRLLRRREVDRNATSRHDVLRLERAYVDAIGRDVERQLGILDLRRRSETDGATRIADRRAIAEGARRRRDQPHDHEGREGHKRVDELPSHRRGVVWPGRRREGKHSHRNPGFRGPQSHPGPTLGWPRINASTHQPIKRRRSAPGSVPASQVIMRFRLEYIPAVAVAVAFTLSVITISQFIVESVRRRRSDRPAEQPS